MFSSPFPNNISFFCGDLSSTKDIKLHSEEEKIAKSFGSRQRKAEFLLGRKIAHLALKEFKQENKPILRNTSTREPAWPKSIRGSITHSGGLAAVAVGLKKDILGIGIDLENISRKINFKISRHICIDDEINWLSKLSPEQALLYLRVIFSAKESIFKCYFPISGKFIKFKDAYVQINIERSEFLFKLSSEFSEIFDARFIHQGVFSIQNNFLLTSIYLSNIQ